MILYAVTIFLAAFLLFQIQPVIAKIILPWFGGSSSVWSTCMLFFQAALLLGYLYAHWLESHLSPRKRAVIHAALLLAGLAALPVTPSPSWKTSMAGNPCWTILALLSVTVGLPYFLLSTTSPLLQSWYARTHAGAAPYRLFALSNLASLLALLSYPVLVEPRLSTRAQAWAWSGAYAFFTLLAGLAAARSVAAPKSLPEPTASAARPAPPALRLRLLWMALPAAASVLLLAITTYLTQDVAPVPFLWIVPLTAYLLSFIICFEAPWLYVRPLFLASLVAALGLFTYMLSVDRGTFRVVPTIVMAVGALFVFCMFCHGELVRLKPDVAYLTSFYVMLSLGGALGGAFVGLAAPNLFNGFYELPIGLALCVALTYAVLLHDPPRWFRRRTLAYGTAALAAAYLAYAGWLARDSASGCRVVVRNFYGELRVRDVDEEDGAGPRRRLVHGVINHGEQFLGEHRRRATTYFCADTGVGRALLGRPSSGPLRVGILGLGCGTLASYGRPGDTYRIYEINPLVLDLARREFTYLRDSAARIELVAGDGRLSLESEPDQHFDVLVMDAFSGDSVPVHLVTREAFRTYFRHLNPGGIVAVNISNKYLDLRPVMERAASESGRQAFYYKSTPEEDDPFCFTAHWVLMLHKGVFPPPSAGTLLEPHPGFTAWTDDYSSLRHLLK